MTFRRGLLYKKVTTTSAGACCRGGLKIVREVGAIVDGLDDVTNGGNVPPHNLCYVVNYQGSYPGSELSKLSRVEAISENLKSVLAYMVGTWM
jgi:hypothetical protein